MRRLAVIALGILLAVGLVGCPPPKPRPIHVDPPHLDPPLPPKPDPLPPRPEPLPAPLGTAGKETVHEADTSSTEREVVCFAYDEFYDPTTGEIFLPSEEEFVSDIFEKLRPHSEEEQLVEFATDAYGLVSNLGNGELQAVAEELACG